MSQSSVNLPQYHLFGEEHRVPGSEAYVLNVRENKLSLTGDTGKIKDDDGNNVYEFLGKLSFSQKKILSDKNGDEIASLKAKVFSLHKKQRIYDKNGEKVLATVQKASVLQLKSEAMVHLGENDEGESDLLISGSYISRRFDIVDRQSGVMLARISREAFTAAKMLANADRYFVSICPGVDAAFMVAICISLDEIYNEQ